MVFWLAVAPVRFGGKLLLLLCCWRELPVSLHDVALQLLLDVGKLHKQIVDASRQTE
jgi:hypothetical protein